MSDFTIPYPPSVNHLYANVPGRGRVKSAGYKAWLTEAGWSLKAQKPAPVAGAYRLTIIAQRPDKRRRDIDNLPKAVSDLLKAQGLIEDDSLAQSIFAGWSLESSVPGGGIIVRLEPAETPIFVIGRAA